MLRRLSEIWARVEVTVAAALAAAISGLILLNVVTRAMGAAIYWVDEAAIYAMVWMTFLAASAALHYRTAVAVTVVPEVAPRLAPALARAVDVAVLVFAGLMLWVCWRWFMPLELARAGFDVKTFQGATFNFIYAEPTTTLGISKVWVWLIMPLFAIGATLHAAANLASPLPVRREEPA
jgi:TRAP-type C4-dicarboxylate transport system permease small subunit